MIKNWLSFFFIIGSSIIYSQNSGVIKGKIIDAKTREALPYVNVVVVGSTIGAVSNENGEFEITKVPLGYNSIQVSYLGYLTTFSEDYLVTNEKTPFIIVELTQNNEVLSEVTIVSSPFRKSIETPLSKQSLEIA